MAGLSRIANRFELHERAGAGGMGIVRRGVDLETGASVAVKLLHPGQEPERFLREASLLATLSHPAIVRYIAHGVTELGRFYIVMDWIDGQTLGDRLASGAPLSPHEALQLGHRLASGLSAAHDEGVVHRDIKPNNVLIPGGELERAILIDFGIARRAIDPHLTIAGRLVGTAAYMSPEQARGMRDPSPASDVFSLGSLLYRALSGQHPFRAGDSTATLAKVLLEDPLPLVELVSGVPPALEQLIREMLRKDPAHRPPNGRAIEERFASMLAGESSAASRANASDALGSSERRVVWMVLVGGMADAETQIAQPSAATPTPRALVVSQAARWEVMADGTGIASFDDTHGGDRAVKLALDVHALARNQPMALAMGLGQAIDRAVRALASAMPGEICVDIDAARALDARHVVVGADGLHRLAFGESASEQSRRLLGRTTPCVGRDPELVALEGLVDQAIDDSVARVALVVGPTGIGKSRLRYELIHRLRAQGRRVETLFGRADSLSAGSPFGLLRHALRGAAKLLDGEPIGESRQKLLERVRHVLGDTTRAFDVAVFLGELANVPFDDADSDALRALRTDPAAMGDAIRAAWLDYLDGELGRNPVMIVLEDVHWGDRPTASLIDAALSTHHDRPLVVVALARPEVFDALPGLWSTRDVVEIRLRPLHRSACEKLVRDVLGSSIDERLRREVIARAEGNAFFLEELIRAVSEGRTELPATVVAVVQGRLDRLDASSRRVLRAASVFGERFWRGALASVLDKKPTDEELDRALDELIDRELVGRRLEATLPDEIEYVFRHSIVRETAYAAFVEADRELAHRKAGAWLERIGKVDALTLAEHFRRGRAPEKAARFYVESAELALEGHDLGAAIERAKLALDITADAFHRARIARVLSHAHLWKGEYADAERASLEAIDLLEPASPHWFVALSEVCSSAGALDHQDVLTRASTLALETEASSDDARAAQVMCLSRAATGHLRHGRRSEALAAIERMKKIRSQASSLTSMMEAWTHHGQASLAYFSGESAEFRGALEAAIEAYDAAGDVRAATNDRVNLGFALAALGDYGRAEELIVKAASQAERLGLAKVSGYAWHNFGWIRMQLGDAARAVELQRKAISTAAEQREAFLEGSARAYLALALSALGEFAEAEREARRAAELLEPAPALRPHALAALARALYGQRKSDEALEVAELALAGADELELPDDSDALVRLVAAEIRHALGNDDGARAVLRASKQRISLRAEHVGDEALRAYYFERVPEHARTFELARALGAD